MNMDGNGMKKIILTDVDGCLLDWSNAFKDWMQVRGFFPDHTKTCYSLSKRYTLPEKEMAALVRQFNASAAVGFLQPYADSVHYVRRLSERGYRFIPITSFGGDHYSEALRIQNLERHFGKVFERHHFLDLNASKDHILEQYAGTEYWWIEDKIENAVDGLKHGLRSVLLKQSHNETYEGDDVLMVHKWKDIYTYVTGDAYVEST